ncbi:MAG: acylphosphatase [Phycisphaerales bacterium]
MNVRYTMSFSGRVQGVGFRWTARSISERYTITGWIRNMEDGSVHCVVEGDADESLDFLHELMRAMKSNITHVGLDIAHAPQDATINTSDGFEIRK